MSGVGNPYHNAQAESFIKTLKLEEIYRAGYGTFADVAVRLPIFIEQIYNTRLCPGAPITQAGIAPAWRSERRYRVVLRKAAPLARSAVIWGGQLLRSAAKLRATADAVCIALPGLKNGR